MSAGWEQAFEEADPWVQSILGGAALGARPPDGFGFELTGPSGRVVVEAEAACSDSKVALIRKDQRSCAAPFEVGGWRVFDLGVEVGDRRAALASKID